MVIVDMLISFRGFDSLLNRGVLWLMAILSLIWFLRYERNAKIFEERWRLVEANWDVVYRFSFVTVYAFVGCLEPNIVRLEKCLLLIHV